MSACTFTKHRGLVDCNGDVWVDDLCHLHVLVRECMKSRASEGEEIEMIESMESESENPWGGEGRPQCLYFRGGSYEVQVQGKHVGTFPELADAIEARDNFRAANLPKPSGRRGKKASAPVEKSTAKAHTNGAARPPSSQPQFQVGDVATLKSGGEPMTVVGFCPDGVNLMTWSKGKLHKVCLPAQCIRSDEKREE